MPVLVYLSGDGSQYYKSLELVLTMSSKPQLRPGGIGPKAYKRIDIRGRKWLGHEKGGRSPSKGGA
jgi:hypothetical protein